MSYASLVAALPADTVTALSGAPAGIDSTDHVYVADKRRNATETEEAWWRPIERVQLRATGQRLARHRFELRLSDKAGTRATLEAWAAELLGHYHGKAKPTAASGIVCAQVENVLIFDGQSTPGPDVEVVATIGFLLEGT